MLIEINQNGPSLVVVTIFAGYGCVDYGPQPLKCRFMGLCLGCDLSELGNVQLKGIGRVVGIEKLAAQIKSVLVGLRQDNGGDP